MKRLFLACMAVLLCLPLLPVQTAQAAASAPDLPLCFPEAYPAPADCLPLGAAASVTDMASRGVVFPFMPLSIQRYDPALQQAPVPYMKIFAESVPFYATLQDAVAGNPAQVLGPGFKYVSMQYKQEFEGALYYLLQDGLWVRADESHASCCVYAGRFAGMVFERNPRTPFGWIVDEARPRRAPSRAAPETGKVLYRETVVPVYNLTEADNTTWYMIGPSSWVERRYIRQLVVNPTPPEGVTNGRWVEVNLYEQTLSVYEDGQLRFATLIASGAEPLFTRPGLFQIYKRLEKGPMSGLVGTDEFYYLQDVPYTLYFDGARALHGAYWRTLYGYPASHGCVNLSIGDAHWVYNWASEGDWVYVHDPSGLTPTDPDFYGEGGA